MSASSPDKSEPKSSLMTRRSFLKNTAIGAGIVVAGTALAPLADAIIQKFHKKSEDPAPQFPEGTINYINPELAPFINGHPVLRNLSENQKAVSASLIEQQIYYYKRENNPRFASLANVKEPDVEERVRNSASYQNLINEKADLLGFKTDSFVRKIAPAIIFVESEGKKDSNLFQLEDVIADDVASEFDIDLGKNRKNLFNQDVNTMIALEYMSRLYKVFPDPTLTIWAFNLGEQIMANAIYAYVISTAKTEMEKEFIKNKFKDSSEAATGYYVGYFKINFIDLLQSQETVDSINADLWKHGENFDDTHANYVSKVLAGDFLIQQVGETRA